MCRVYKDAQTDQIITEDVAYRHDVTTTGHESADLLFACKEWVESFDEPIEHGQYFVEAREPGTFDLIAESECVEVRQ